MDNLQDVLVEEGQGGKGQKIQEDSAGKTMVLLSLLAAKGRRFKRTDDGDGDNDYSDDGDNGYSGDHNT